MDDNSVKEQQQIIEVLNHLIDNHEWDSTLLFKVLQKKVIAYRDALEDEIASADIVSSSADSAIPSTVVKSAEDVAVYISLYRNFGDDIVLWQKALSSFSGSTLGRPVYLHEDEVKRLIAGKLDRRNEAYIEAWVDKGAIINVSAEKALFDSYGARLVSLRQGFLKVENIKYFTHGSGAKFFYNGVNLTAAS